jgi:methionyl-tRNA formyltransferase
MRVLFLGLPLAALLLERDGHEIVLAAVCRRDSLGLRRLTRVLGPERVLAKPKLDQAFVERARALRPELVVSWFWTNRIPMDLVRMAPFGGFGVHPSLLPRHRGPDPTAWAILAGDAETGVTAHRLAEHYDTGAILDAERLAIDPAWSAWELARALDRPSLTVLRRVARAFADGRPPRETEQDPAQATEAPMLGEADQELSFATPTAELLRRVRSLAPAPGAYFQLGADSLTVLRALACEPPSALERPGQIAVYGGRVIVRTLDGAIELSCVECDGRPVSLDELAERVESAAGAELVAGAGAFAGHLDA